MDSTGSDLRATFPVMDANDAGSWNPPGSGPSLPPPPAVPPAVFPAGPPSAFGAPAGPPIGIVDGTPQLSFDTPDSSGQRRSKLVVGGAVAGVLALGAAGVFAVGQLRGGNTGGASSPEAVGTELMGALEQEDMLGMIDLLLPGEREVFREPLTDVVSELARLDILSDDASLADLAGLDIEMSNELTGVEPTNVTDISNITMSASITASVDGDQLPIGEFITEVSGEGFDPSDLDQPATTEDFALPMTVVEQDGRWYLSLFHTAAESLRGESGEPIPETGLVPSGGDSPENAVDVLLDGVEQLDIGKVIASINPNEAAALQRYAPMFLDDIAPFVDDVPLEWQVTRSEFAVTGSGSKRFVAITALRIDGTADGIEFSVDVAGNCAVFEADGERIDSCELATGAGDAQTALDDLFGGSLGGSLDTGDLTATIEEVLADYEPLGITVQQVDGQWFVSPLGSGFDQLLALLRALDRDELDRLVDVSTTFIEDFGGEFGEFDALPFPGEFVDEEAIEVTDPDLFEDDPFSDPETDAETDAFDAEVEASAACYELGVIEQVTACLQTAIDAGTLPEYYLGVELQFPECGLADSVVGNTSLYEMSDEEYTALIEASAACFGDLIARGEIDETAVPP